jgi:hypothetical protein
MNLPEALHLLLQPLFDDLPLERAMPELCPKQGGNEELRSLVESVLQQAPFRSNLGLVDAAEAAYPQNPEAVVRLQREEWANLFAWCAANV